jgi:hypothetical protein
MHSAIARRNSIDDKAHDRTQQTINDSPVLWHGHATHFLKKEVLVVVP